MKVLESGQSGPAPDAPGACVHDLDASLLGLMLASMHPIDLGRAQGVCRQWRAAAGGIEVRRAAFLRYWGLSAVHGHPQKASALETAALSTFVRCHLVGRCDTLQMLAVRHGCSVQTIKRANNLISDHIMSRPVLYIPVASAEELRGQAVSWTHIPLAKRDVAVLQGEHLTQVGMRMAKDPAAEALEAQALRAKLCAILGRSLRVDAATAQYYMDEANGDIKVAMRLYENDSKWEATTPGPIKLAPVKRWIDGELGL